MTDRAQSWVDGAWTERRQFLLGGALVLASAGALALKPGRASVGTARGDLDTLIPARIGAYAITNMSGVVLPVEGELSQRVYNQVLTRIYHAPGLPPVMLVIAYGVARDAGLSVHRPESCYPAAGYAISDVAPAELTGLGRTGNRQAVLLSARRAEQTEQVYFWTRVGDVFPQTPLDLGLAVMKANLRGHLPDGILVRLSVVSDDRGAALRQMQMFNAEMLRGLSEQGKHMILGRDA